MAVHLSYACFAISPRNQSRIYRVRGVASEDYGTLTSPEEKVKLGGSELKVTTLGVGAWSWGDNSYWNNFEWDGKFQNLGQIIPKNWNIGNPFCRLIHNIFIFVCFWWQKIEL